MDMNAVYLTIIILLIVLLVYLYAKFQHAKTCLTELEEKIGVGEVYCASTKRKDGAQLRPFDEKSLGKDKTYKEYYTEVEQLIDNAAKLNDFGKSDALSKACLRALKTGKHLRAIILMDICRTISKGKTDPAEAALFVEYIHAASLIIDDMPEFDNDLIRREQLSIHAEFGKTTAQLSGIILVSTGFQNMCRQIDWIRAHRPDIKNIDRICTKLADMTFESIGPYGLAGGQFIDIDKETVLNNTEQYIDLMQKKTAVLFELAFCVGWIIAGGAYSKLELVQEVGKNIGIAFQIADDISDVKTDAITAAEKGKPDLNFASKYTMNVALIEYNKFKNGAILLMKQLGIYTPLWEKELFPLIEPKIVDE